MPAKISRLCFYGSTAALLCWLNTGVLAGETTRISVNSQGEQSNSTGSTAFISANGRYIAFDSNAANLVQGDNNKKRDVFVHDRWIHKTELVSTSLNGMQIDEQQGESTPLGISGDGRYVALLTSVNKLVSGNWNNTLGIFVYDRLTHKAEHITNVQFNGQVPAGNSLSQDGRYVVFSSTESDLVPHDTNNASDAFVYDRLTHKTERVSVNSQGKQSNGYIATWPSISADGRYVVFDTAASNLVRGDSNKASDVFVHDRLTRKTERISVNSRGKQAHAYGSSSFAYNISAEGRYVAFGSNASTLVPKDTNKAYDVFVHDRLSHKTERVSIASDGQQAYPSRIGSINASMSQDGRYVVFISDANNLVVGDSNRDFDVFVHDRVTHKTERVSVTSKGAQRNNAGVGDIGFASPTISADGRYISFSSASSNLVAHDTNKRMDTFVRDTLLDTKHHANLAVALSQKPTALKPNTSGRYLYTITNQGPDAVSDISLVYLISGAHAIKQPSHGKCSRSTVAAVCHLGPLAAGKKLTLRVTVKARTKAFRQQVTISSAPLDAVRSNNQISVVTPIK